MLIDVHTHLNDFRFNGSRNDVIEKITNSGVEIVINCGSSLPSSEASIALSREYPFIYACIGIHPHETGKITCDTIGRLTELLKSPKCVAVGEIGLDYHYENTVREEQIKWFRIQMELAAQNDKPVVVHSRDSTADTLGILREYAGKVRGILHCYSGSSETAHEIIKLGYSFSFGGVVTFKNARVCRETVHSIPLEYIMLETDAPYLTPHPYRSLRNDSSYLPLIRDSISAIKSISPEEVGYKTGENALKIFNIKT